MLTVTNKTIILNIVILTVLMLRVLGLKLNQLKRQLLGRGQATNLMILIRFLCAIIWKVSWL